MARNFFILLLFLFPIFFAICIGITLLLRIVWLAYIHFQGPFFTPSSPKRIDNILAILKPKKGQKAADLGSGDGRVLIALAKKGVKAEGYEIDPFLIFKAKKYIKNEGLENKIRLRYRNFWKADLSSYDLIVIYGIKHIMQRLEKKVIEEAKKGTKIASVFFQFPSLKYKKKKGDVYLYIK